MGKLSRTKGHSFERKIANEFIQLGYPEARRHLEYQDGEARGVDLNNTLPFLVQCKKHKEYKSINTIYEIQDFNSPGVIPLLITAGDRKEPMAVLRWSDLKSLIQQLKNSGNLE